MKCRHKMRFTTQEEAAKHGRVNLQAPYKCPRCGFFHLTKNAQSEEPRGREREAEARHLDAASRQVREDWKQIVRRKRRTG